MLLKLTPTTEQHKAMLDTMHAFNKAANYVSSIAFAEKTANKFALQKLVYGELRTTYKLAAQLAIRAISKASEAYKRDKSIQPSFRPEGAIVYDQRVMSFKGLLSVSLLTLQGRVLVPFQVGSYQAARMDSIKGQADLIYRNGVFYLAVTVDVPTPTPDEPTDILGVDLGIINLATSSDGETFSGEQVEKTRKRYPAWVDTPMTQVEAGELQVLNVHIMLTADQVAAEILEAVTEDRRDLTLAPNPNIALLLQIMKDDPDQAEQIAGEHYRQRLAAMPSQ